MANPFENLKLRQAWVLRHPCEQVKDCGKLGYVDKRKFGGLTLATSLTIDLFTKPLAWHSQVIRFDASDQPMPLYGQDQSDLLAMAAIARELVAGVGVSASQQMEVDQLAVGYRRDLTVEEAAAAFYHLSRQKPQADAPKPAVGQLNEYDFANRKLQVGDGLFLPVRSQTIYERKHSGNQ